MTRNLADILGAVRHALACVLLTVASAFADEPPSVKPVASIRGLPSIIAFGSCAHQDKPQPILRTIVRKHPDLFIYLGDNIYGDTLDMEILRQKYAKLAAKPEFELLRSTVPTIATWDDHDYGWNDAGKEYSKKEESKQIFLDFWRVPDDSDRRSHAGIYTVHRFTDGQRTLQVILLDTRSFRDPLLRNTPESREAGFKNDYQPDEDPQKSFLGSVQWKWLEQQLRQPADLRIIASSIQFGHEYNGWESWTNLPQQHAEMMRLIAETKADGVIFISGDVHWGEISERQLPGGYTLHDVTASGLTEDWPTVEPNRFRHGKVVRENHFGMISVDWSADDPSVTLSIVDLTGAERVTKTMALSALTIQPLH